MNDVYQPALDEWHAVGWLQQLSQQSKCRQLGTAHDALPLICQREAGQHAPCVSQANTGVMELRIMHSRHHFLKNRWLRLLQHCFRGSEAWHC